MGKTNIAHFTEDDLVKFKKEYEKAKNSNLVSFKFKGNEYLVTYAKYVIEYLESLVSYKNDKKKKKKANA